MMFLNLRRFLMVSLAVVLLVPALSITPAEARHHHKKHAVQKVQDRFAEIVIEANTGYVLSERNADKRLYPASLTKMMTLYLTFDALQDGTLSRNQRLPVSRHASSQEPSSLGLSPGDTIRVEDAVLSIATKSANDSAVVLAEALGGSEEHFAKMMTAKAQELGMHGTHFLNASGLFKQGHYSTARDMAILAQALVRNHPNYYRVFSTESFTYNGEVMPNHNHLMSSYRGMDGLKTGYVYASGYNLAASAVRNGTRLIGVIFGGATAKSRNNAMAQLLNQSFARVGSVRVASALNTPRPEKPVMPAQRPIVAPDTTPEVVADTNNSTPQFNAMGMVVDQGDAALNNEDGGKNTAAQNAAQNNVPANNPLPAIQPQTINTTPIVEAAPPPAAQTAPPVENSGNANGSWAIQIGAFASHDAGEQALQIAKAALQGMVSGIDSIAPLMTPQGMVYRARLSGLGRTGALQACHVLKGNCLVLSVE
jgi:D-alanyl-D-alanine carboxypeptidase